MSGFLNFQKQEKFLNIYHVFTFSFYQIIGKIRGEFGPENRELLHQLNCRFQNCKLLFTFLFFTGNQDKVDFLLDFLSFQIFFEYSWFRCFVQDALSKPIELLH